jgi:NAD(P)H-hydrate epimerase
MVPVLSRAQMRAFDACAIDACRVPSLVLMENAGRGATDVLVREVLGGRPAEARVIVVCGVGNNGGDGLVIARHLLVRGARPVVLLAGDEARASRDARLELDAWRGLGGELRMLPKTAEAADAFREVSRDAAAIVDALFGTGLERAIEGFLAELVEAMNAASAPRFAVDLPSGLDADTGGAHGAVVEARVTATFAHPKLGLLTPNGGRLAGRVHVVDIGVPGSLVDRVGRSADLLETADLASMLRPRASAAHKNSAGHVLVVAGSPGKVGAPQLVARGAMRGGAGLLTIASWPDSARAIEARVLEAMTARIDRADPARDLDAILEGKQAVAVGPGLGLDEPAGAAVTHVLGAFRGPLVVDADALTLFAGRAEALRAAASAILTPHPGELGRLLGKSTAEIEADRFGAARAAVAATGAVVVLKGAHTLIASPDGRMAVSPVACPALGTAGSGDVLAGVVAAMSCSLPRFEAACAAVFAHALAGEAWSRAHGGADRGLLASEIADRLPDVLSRALGSTSARTDG